MRERGRTEEATREDRGGNEGGQREGTREDRGGRERGRTLVHFKSKRMKNYIKMNQCVRRGGASPLKLSCEQVHSEWMMLMTRPWVEARSDSGPVATSSVTTWNRYGR